MFGTAHRAAVLGSLNSMRRLELPFVRGIVEGCLAGPVAATYSTLITSEEAVSSFKAFHARNNTYFLGPGGFVLAGEEHRWMRVQIPYWAFSATCRYRVKLKGSTTWSEEQRLELDERDAIMQTCGTFKYRHDFVEMFKGEPVVNSFNGIDSIWACDTNEDFEKHDFELTRGLAWDFVLRNVERALREQHCANGAQGAEVRVVGTPHGSRRVFVPAHVIEYTYADKVDVHHERSKDRFYAIVCGINGEVASEQHVSVRRAAAAGGAGAVASMGLASVVGYESVLGWSAFDYGFIGAGSAAAAALFAQVQAPKRRRATEEGVENCVDDDDSAALERQYRNEWARWEDGSVGFDVQPDKRRRWAESIWNEQRRRRSTLRQVLDERTQAKLREEENERRRARLSDSESSRFRVGQVRNRDWGGHYRSLGLDVSGEQPPTKYDIKRAFLRRVRELHPDTGLNEAVSQSAKKEWLKVLAAYEVLKCDDKRQRYDRGESPDR